MIWKTEFLVNRHLLKCSLIKKFLELAKINAQDSCPAIFYRNKRLGALRRILAFATYIIHGGGVMRYTDWAWGKRYKEYSRKILLKENMIFSSIFDVEKIIKLKKGDMRLYENLVKIKEVLDLIESKGYKKFFKSN